MNPCEDERQEETEEAAEEVNRNDWLAQEVDLPWTHLASGDLCSGPTSGFCDIFVRREDDGSCSLRFFGEGLQPSDPPIELDPECYATDEETLAALVERGFEVELEDLPEDGGKHDSQADSR